MGKCPVWSLYMWPVSLDIFTYICLQRLCAGILYGAIVSGTGVCVEQWVGPEICADQLGGTDRCVEKLVGTEGRQVRKNWRRRLKGAPEEVGT